MSDITYVVYGSEGVRTRAINMIPRLLVEYYLHSRGCEIIDWFESQGALRCLHYRCDLEAGGNAATAEAFLKQVLTIPGVFLTCPECSKPEECRPKSY